MESLLEFRIPPIWNGSSSRVRETRRLYSRKPGAFHAHYRTYVSAAWEAPEKVRGASRGGIERPADANDTPGGHGFVNSLEVERELGLPPSHLDLELRGVAAPVLVGNPRGPRLAGRPVDRDAVGAGHRAVPGLVGGEDKRPVGVDLAPGLPA